MPWQFPQETFNSVLSLLGSTNPRAEITSKTGASFSCMTKVTAKHHPHLKLSKGGCPQKLNPTNVRYAVDLVTKGKKVGTCPAAKELFNLTGDKASPTTLHKVLKEAKK
ncbi:hypothetical protein OPQ81_008039 [Rhizoctonia solani]|nr:hypothetical protein OPQ81_008039 [Rhizoctonia solani]